MDTSTDAKEKSDGIENDQFKKVQDLNTTALKILALGMSKDRFMGKFGLPHVLLHSSVHLMLTIFGGFELICSLMLSENTLELIAHLYVVSYIWCVGFQFTYICHIIEEIDDQEPDMINFHTTQLVLETAKRILGENLKRLITLIYLFSITELGTIIIYVGGAFLEAAIAFGATGTVEQIAVLSYYPAIPLWGQMIIAAANCITTSIAQAVLIAVVIITGVRAVKIKAQCEVINAALATKDVDLKICIQDHVDLLKIAKRTIEILRILNNPCFYAVYLLVAFQLLHLSVIEPSSAIFFGMGFDFLATFMVLLTQTWFSSYITHSLESIADNAYFTEWCGKGKSHVKNVMIMMTIAQRPYEQMIWLKSLKIERATILKMLYKSYSFYTLLMILQGKK